MHIRIFRQCRSRIAGQGDQRHAQPLEQRQQGQNLVGFPGIGQRQHHILSGDHAHVAVAGFGRVNKKRRAAGAGQRRRDLSADVPGFANTEHHDAALAVQHEIAGIDEVAIDAAFELFHRLGFNRQNLAGQLSQLIGVHGNSKMLLSSSRRSRGIGKIAAIRFARTFSLARSRALRVFPGNQRRTTVHRLRSSPWIH